MIQALKPVKSIATHPYRCHSWVSWETLIPHMPKNNTGTMRIIKIMHAASESYQGIIIFRCIGVCSIGM